MEELGLTCMVSLKGFANKVTIFWFLLATKKTLADHCEVVTQNVKKNKKCSPTTFLYTCSVFNIDGQGLGRGGVSAT
jgi:hypothetical protein